MLYAGSRIQHLRGHSSRSLHALEEDLWLKQQCAR